jgi:hypothetical protein
MPQSIIASVIQAWQREQAELARADLIEAVRVYSQTATGTGNIDETFSLDRYFRLVYVRCRFVGGSGRSAMTLSVDSTAGSVYDATLYTIRFAGSRADVNFRLRRDETALPSAWSLQPGDAIRINWTNPDPGNTTWGLEVGLAPAQ